MNTLKNIFIKETRVSMLTLSLSISFVLTIILVGFQILQLKNDFHLVENYILESTQNAIFLDQPILLQRSISEFWKAFESKRTSLAGIEVTMNKSLISQNGQISPHQSFFGWDYQTCFSTGYLPICVRYIINPTILFFESIVAIIAIFASTGLVYIFRRRLAVASLSTLIQPLEKEIARISSLSSDFEISKQNNSFENPIPTQPDNLGILEINQLSNAYRNLLTHNRNYHALSKASEIAESMATLAAQVAHDIRSPLTALGIATATLPQIPNEHKTIIRSSMSRINDIANELLKRGRSIENNPNLTKQESKEQKQGITELLPAVVDMLISEKRFQFREHASLSIETDYDDSYGAFAKVDMTDFKRVLSNLINNSVEAVDAKTGKVTVSVRNYDSTNLIFVRDNGKGIPHNILERLGEKGLSFGKEGTNSGSGLGLYHAKKAIESIGGQLFIDSRLGQGTEIKIQLPKAEVPSWFTPDLRPFPFDRVVIVDDDHSILEVWKKRLNEIGLVSERIITLSTAAQLAQINDTPSFNFQRSLFLIDYELSEPNENGLDLIAKYQLSESSILVTSRYEEEDIRRRCDVLGVKIIPKNMIAYIPILA